MPFTLGSYFGTTGCNAAPDAAALHNSMMTLQSKTRQLRDDIAAWTGNPFTALSIIATATGTVDDIHRCTAIAKSIQDWTVDEEDISFSLMTQETELLTQAVDSTIFARPKFLRIPYLGDAAARAIIGRLEIASEDLIASLVSRARPARAKDASKLAKDAQQNFARVYAHFGSDDTENVTEGVEVSVK